MEASQRGFFFSNGINGRTGEYLFPPLGAKELVQSLRKAPKNREKPLVPDINAKNLAETGWGIIFHEREDPAVREALLPLMEHRRAQASQDYEHLYQEYNGERAYHVGENKEDFLCARDATLGSLDPDRMPYYLLLVGSPDLIPFQFQSQLDVQYGVGRLCFDTPQEYAQYAKGVIEAETYGGTGDRRVSLFGVRNPDDEVAALMSKYLVPPLAERLAKPARWQKSTGWEFATVLGENATKQRLGQLLGGEETPALLFTACHGMGFGCGDPLQRDHQGALLCQNWPGPKEWRQAIPPDQYFSADDVGADANLAGLIAFHFACHGAGAPAFDEFSLYSGQAPRPVAPKPFVTRLPQRLLGSGALAVIGHVERAWVYSFLSKAVTSQVAAFEYALRLLMEGYPVGFAMEHFNYQYAELATDLTLALQKVDYGEPLSPGEIKGLWIANNDARNYVVLGDPAVRLAVR